MCAGLSVVFAAVALVLAFQGPGGSLPVFADRIDIVAPPTGPLRSVVFGVLSGVAFFTGLACFFWSAVVEARGQRAEIIRLLGERSA